MTQEADLVRVEFHDDNDGSVTIVNVPAGTKITEAASKAQIYIPTLCHHPRLPPAGKCGVCACSVENGPTPTQLACSTTCRPNDDGSAMKVHIHGKILNGLANAALKRSLALPLPAKREQYEQNNAFAPCGSLEIEDLVKWIGTENIDTSSQSITYDPSLCIGCSRCVRACDHLQGMKVLESPIPTGNAPVVGIAQTPPCMTTKAGRPLNETDCISCGQCTLFCPTGAIKEVDHTAKVMRALLDPEKVVVLQTAPSVRVTIAEMFGGRPGDCSEGQLVGAAKACGFRFVFDTNLAADLTIMEEANELLQRINIAANGKEEEKKQKPLPMFTSCCPGWINLVEQSYPELIPHISSCRSPMGMLSGVIRHHWWPQQSNILSQHGQKTGQGSTVDQSKLFLVAVMPCTAKKDEIARKQFRMANGHQETDAVLTVREFGRLIELRGVARRDDLKSFTRIPELVYDNPFGESSGAGVIFGTTGGVMEAALRTAADVLSKQDLKDVTYQSVRGLAGIKESTIRLGQSKEISLNIAVCHQMRNVREFLARVEEGKKQYHFVEIMTCPGGCIGGGGLPQSRDEHILLKRMKQVYSLDERMVKRKSHENEAVQLLYKDFLGEPLSRVSHTHLHTRYFPRLRKPPIALKASATEPIELGGDNSSTIYVVYGTQSGTAAQAAKDVKVELQNFVGRSSIRPQPQVCLVAGNGMFPDGLVEHLRGSLAAIFVTSTFGEGEFPSMIEKFWEFLAGSKPNLVLDDSLRYGVFGLGSSMYAVADQFNKAARQLDQKLAELGGERILDVGLGDDQDSEQYHGELDKWLEELEGKLFAKTSSGSKSSHLDPPEPLFRLSLAPGKHLSGFRPLPPKYHFVKLVETESLVSQDYDRPAARLCFDLEDTGLHYEVGDHLAILPRNPVEPVEAVLSLYSPEITGAELLSVEPIDHLTESPFPSVLTARELVWQYLDLCGRPSRSFFRQLFLFAHAAAPRDYLRSLIDKNHPDYSQEEFDRYTATHTYADVLCQFADTALPPFEYLLSMIPTICPRLYSIASSPRHHENKLELLVVLHQWKDSVRKHREGLATQYLFNADAGETVSVQILTGILQPPTEATTPIVMFGLGTGVAPFRGFLQDRQHKLDHNDKIGPATLYVGFRHEKNDFYLKEDLKQWIESGALTAVYPAFSHDNLDQRGGKLYFISDMIAENPMDAVKALQLKLNEKRSEEKKEDEAKQAPEIYYCGPAMGIPETIQQSLVGALCSSNGGGMEEKGANAFMETLVKKEYRFHAECF